MRLLVFKSAVLISGFFASSLASAVSQDWGRIEKFYVDDTGNIAIQLVGGFPKSAAANECPTSNGFAGVTMNAPELKSAVLAAKASGAEILVNISGCDAGGSWYKITSVYIN